MFGAGPQDRNGYVMNRAMPHFDFHAGSDFRLFCEFEFDFEGGRNGDPRSQIDEDRGDVHQAFLEIGPRVSRPHGMSLRVGRQEVVLGSGRLFDNNEGPNVKLSFDGIRMISESAHARLDLFAVKPVENNLGFFRRCVESRRKPMGSLSDSFRADREPRAVRPLLHRTGRQVIDLQQRHCA
jgi:hypothetical protein